MTENTSKISNKDACFIAIRALSYVSQSSKNLSNFIEESGVSPSDIIKLTENTDFLGGVLAYVLADESLLLSFCSFEQINPKQVDLARMYLQGDMK